MLLNGLLANPHVAGCPAIAVPVALTLPVTLAVGAAGIARAAIVAIAGAVIAVRIGVGGDRAADDGAAKQAEADARAPAAAPGISGRSHRNRQRGRSHNGHQCLLHGYPLVTNSREGLERKAFHCSESSTLPLNAQ